MEQPNNDVLCTCGRVGRSTFLCWNVYLCLFCDPGRSSRVKGGKGQGDYYLYWGSIHETSIFLGGRAFFLTRVRSGQEKFPSGTTVVKGFWIGRLSSAGSFLIWLFQGLQFARNTLGLKNILGFTFRVWKRISWDCQKMVARVKIWRVFGERFEIRSHSNGSNLVIIFTLIQSVRRRAWLTLNQ